MTIASITMTMVKTRLEILAGLWFVAVSWVLTDMLRGVVFVRELSMLAFSCEVGSRQDDDIEVVVVKQSVTFWK